MPRPPKILSDHPGHGTVPAERHHIAIVRYRLFLNRGDEIFPSRRSVEVDLSDRRTMPGLRYGILGMRTGGRREFRIPAHLAFGEDGLPDEVPPHAVIRCDLELLDLQEPGATERSPHLSDPGLSLLLHGAIPIPAEPDDGADAGTKATDGMPQKANLWVYLCADGEGHATVTWILPATPDQQRRHSRDWTARQRYRHLVLPPDTAARFIHWVLDAPALHPTEFPPASELVVEAGKCTHPTLGPDHLRLQVGAADHLCRPDSPALLHSELWQWLHPLLAEKLALGPPPAHPGQPASELPPAS